MSSKSREVSISIKITLLQWWRINSNNLILISSMELRTHLTKTKTIWTSSRLLHREMYLEGIIKILLKKEHLVNLLMTVSNLESLGATTNLSETCKSQTKLLICRHILKVVNQWLFSIIHCKLNRLILCKFKNKYKCHHPNKFHHKKLMINLELSVLIK